MLLVGSGDNAARLVARGVAFQVGVAGLHRHKHTCEFSQQHYHSCEHQYSKAHQSKVKHSDGKYISNIRFTIIISKNICLSINVSIQRKHSQPVAAVGECRQPLIGHVEPGIEHL